MYIDMSGRIAGKQDRPSLIIEGLPRAPQIAKNCKKNQDGEEAITSFTGAIFTMRYMYNKEI